MENLFLKQADFELIFKKHLKIETYSKSIASLFNDRYISKIDYSPYYQRNYVWDDDKATYFIESILLGTEIPPLIFFNNGSKIEVIDGRQRFETIKRFKQDDFALTKKGLLALKQLSRKTYDLLASDQLKIRDLFDDAKIRIFEFRIVNEPKLDDKLEDKIKKEIFSRYNSGITPLKKSEIDNAKYNEDDISSYFKEKLSNNILLKKLISDIFFKNDEGDEVSIENIMNFVRKIFALSIYPIKYYARGTNRTELMEKAYEYFANNVDDVEELFKKNENKIQLIKTYKDAFIKQNIQANRLVFECLLWILYILENNDFDLNNLRGDIVINDFIKYISSNISKFNDVDYHYYKETMTRYDTIQTFFHKMFGIDLSIYVSGDSESSKKIKDLKKYQDTETKLSELETLRTTKPEPSRNSIDDIIRLMGKKRFLVRPPYQRSEVINEPKASAIIESILLGIPIPAIFIFKREDGVSEVIDGQQRLLTILGFIGAEYMDEKGNNVISRNHKYALRNLRILKALKGSKFEDLAEDLKDKILDFELFVVEIEEKLNPNFNPIDLFIRLNDKPYPILENSFEMWNSWVDFDIIKQIKEIIKKNRSWFYIRSIIDKNDRDRMENEEMFTLLAYLDYIKNFDPTKKSQLTYSKEGRINTRVSSKDSVTSFLSSVSEKQEIKNNFQISIKNISSFIHNLKKILTNNRQDINDELINKEIKNIFQPKEAKYFRRTLQEFYILWTLVGEVSENYINNSTIELKSRIKEIFEYMKEVPEKDILDNKGLENFTSMIDKFKDDFSK